MKSGYFELNYTYFRGQMLEFEIFRFRIIVGHLEKTRIDFIQFHILLSHMIDVLDSRMATQTVSGIVLSYPWSLTKNKGLTGLFFLQMQISTWLYS